MEQAATSWIGRVADSERIEAQRRRIAVVIVHLRHHAIIPTGRITAGADRFGFGLGRGCAAGGGIREDAERRFLHRLYLTADEEHADAVEDRLALLDLAAAQRKIGRASCRERVCQYV